MKLDCIRQLTKAIDHVQDDIEKMKKQADINGMSQLIEVLPHLRIAMSQLGEARVLLEKVNQLKG